MQDRWFGDEGDFVKYTLLRRICGITARNTQPRLSLGVVWYLRESKRIHYLDPNVRYGSEDRELVQRLRCWHQEKERQEERRGVRLIEDSGLFPNDTVWFRCPVPIPRASRAAWSKRARQAVSKSRVVFLDPDTGLQPSSRGGAAYVLLAELEAFCSLPQKPTVVVYQHRRRKRWEAQVSDQIEQIAKLSCRDCFAVRHPKLGQRFFYVIPSEDDCDLVRKRVEELSWQETALRRSSPTAPRAGRW